MSNLDSPPSLYAAIMAQLEREGRQLPTVTVKYAVASQLPNGKWTVGPETINLKLVKQLVSRLQLQTPISAMMAAKGTPTAVVLELTRTTPAKEPAK